MSDTLEIFRGNGAVFIGGPRGDAENYVATLAASLGRACATCSLCCKVLDIDEPELTKPRGEWCVHCKPGQGCAIYNKRPPVCRAFGCQWLVDGSFGEEWKPTRAKMVLRMVPNEGGGSALALNVHVDPAYPNAWRKPPYYEHLRDRSMRMSVMIYVGKRRIAMGLGRETELKENEQVFFGPDGKDLIFQDLAKAEKFAHALSKIEAAARRQIAVEGKAPSPLQTLKKAFAR